jgi:hypothetical protein
MQCPIGDQPLKQEDAQHFLSSVQSRIVQSVIAGAANASRRFADDELLASTPMLRAMTLNQSIIKIALDRLRGTAARSEYVGNAWRWAIEDRILLRFKKAGANGWPVNNYPTRQSLQYVNLKEGHQLSFLPTPDMLTALYTMDMLEEQVVDIQIVRMSSRRTCSWAYSIYARSAIIPVIRQEVLLPEAQAPSRVRLKKSKKKAP